MNPERLYKVQKRPAACSQTLMNDPRKLVSFLVGAIARLVFTPSIMVPLHMVPHCIWTEWFSGAEERANSQSRGCQLPKRSPIHKLLFAALTIVYKSRWRTSAPESYDAAFILPASSCSTNSSCKRTPFAAFRSSEYLLYSCDCGGTKLKLVVS